MVRDDHRRNVWLTAVALLLAGAAAPAGALAPLTDQPGDPRRGLSLTVDSEKGNCLICHDIPAEGIPPGAAGDLGPPLAGVASRLSPDEMRQRIADPKVVSPDTIMPAYFVSEGLVRVAPRFQGKTILTAQEIEDVVAFLETLK
jgi:sulfur-oxidizing protein SoxX